MAQPDHHEKPFHELITRLEQELEQSRVSVEDSQAEIAALTDLNSRLKSRIAAAETARAEAESRGLRVRDEAAKSMELVTGSLREAPGKPELHAELQESSVLSGVDEFDLVFSDVLLPGGGSGLDLAREMGRRRMAVPVILTSGFGGGMTQRLAAANLPFLRKPYRIEALHQTIDAALGSPGALPQDPVGPT